MTPTVELAQVEARLEAALEEYRAEIIKPLETEYEKAVAAMDKLDGVRGAYARFCEARGRRDGIRAAIDLIKGL